MAERQLIDGRLSSSSSDTPRANAADADEEADQNKTTATVDHDITTAMNKLDIDNDSIPLEDIPDCAVCLQRCIHPVRLPCSHVFCFLCVKGVAMQSGRCALCRKQITAEFFSNPTLLRGEKEAVDEEEPVVRTDQYTWYYEGRNGWWQYEERTNQELEESYRKKLRTFELLIAGFVYTIDLDNMVQMRRSDPSRRRRIKRDLASAPKKGIAGLKIAQQTEGEANISGSSREVLGEECDKDNQAAGGMALPVDGATQTPSDSNLILTNQDYSEEDGASLNTVQRGTSTTDDTAYEVLPQANARLENRGQQQNNQHLHSDDRAEAVSSTSKSSRTNSANNHKKSKSRPQIRDTVPRHPSSHTRPTTLNNDTYGLVVHHQRAHSSPSTSNTSSQSQVELQGAVSRLPSNRTISSHDDNDLNAGDALRPSSRRVDESQTDGQSRRQVRHRRRQQRSSDV